ncbi:ABC transporter substrate-binding protein [Kineococcus arenarius]|uniref:ABC transporter substrate-binding protein n=1 Tax=unclassified Kineococcus TaxID=2621656 RepID=UPI003D7CAF8D
MRLSRSALPALGAAAALTLTSCTTASEPVDDAVSQQVAPGFLAVTDSSAPEGGELTVQLDYDAQEAGGLDPQLATAARAWSLESLVYETLVTVDEDMQPAPGLATSWSTPDDRTYVFELAPSATFSNGRPMTSGDVVGSIQRLLDGDGVWAGQLGPVASVTATGDHQVTVSLEEPHTPFLAALANTPAAVLPMQEVASGAVDLATTMLGTGPLVVTEHRQDEQWRFGINDHWPGAEELGFSSVRIDVVPDENTRIAALKSGSTDLAVLSSVDSAGALASTPSVTTVVQQNTDYFYLVENSRSATSALADPDVRLAVNSAIDRSAIADLVFAGQARPTGATPVGLEGSCDPARLPSAGSAEPTADVADRLDGLRLNLLVYSSEPALAQIAAVVQQNLAEIGVDVQIQNHDYAAYSQHVYSSDPGDFDLALSWFAGYADPSMVTAWWKPADAGFSSVYMNGSPELDALIESARTTPAGPERDQVLDQLCARADQESEMVPLVTRPTVVGYSDRTLSPTLTATEGYGNVLRDVTRYRAS